MPLERGLRSNFNPFAIQLETITLQPFRIAGTAANPG
jgi:hypothetical protein